MRATHRPLTPASVARLLEQAASKQLADQIVGSVQGGISLTQVFDEAIAPAMWHVGTAWERGELDVYEEHLRSQALASALAQLRSRIDEISSPERQVANAPQAIGAVSGEEQHCLASMMIELVLNQQGWQAESLGARVPCESLILAAQALSARIIWISYTCSENFQEAIEENHRIFASLRPSQRLILGGQGLTRELRRQLKFHFVGDSMGHLIDYVESLAE